MYHFKSGVGAVAWCENPPANQCIKASEYQAVMKKVTDACAYKKVSSQLRGGFSRNGLGVMCGSYAFRADVQLSSLDQYDPCYVETLPKCFVPEDTPPLLDVPDTRMNPPVDEEPEDDDESNQYMIGGILAAVVVVGVGYAVFKNRKKKGKKKGKK